ncbi:MAG: Rrf2 family transcriptional regulator [Rhodobacteraceae bacterium]|jgi:Rrf2 family nitric oxide-sensitive transcriptional repressor|nr:Rrf2 family transcriptional regulator [Paracoccaceae bacterium]
MRLQLRTNLAIRVLMACAVNDGRTVRTAEIAGHCNASLNHMLQVVSLLQARGFVTTLRGRSGGLRLARPMEEISVGKVFRLFEAGVPFAECFDPATNTCPLSPECRMRGYISRAVEAFFHELDMVTLADLVKGNCGLSALLDIGEGLRGACGAPRMAAAPAKDLPSRA